MLTTILMAGLTFAAASARAQQGDAPQPQTDPQAEPQTEPQTEPPAKPGEQPKTPTPPSDKSDPMRPRVKLETAQGDIVLELDAEKAPESVLNFIRYVKDGFYDGTVFHRLESNFVIQGGGYTTTLEVKSEGLREPIRLESRNGLTNVRGTIAMARTNDPNSATSQFFINVVDNDRLDYPSPDGHGYTVFGKVIEGMEAVDKIRHSPVQSSNKVRIGPYVPTEPESVGVRWAKLISEFDEKKCTEMVAEAAAAEKARVAAEDTERKKREGEYVAKAEKELSEQEIKLTRTESGLMVADLKVGDGPSPQPNEMVSIHYTGWLIDGTEFDSSAKRGPYTAPLAGFVKGFTEGISTMKVGGKRKLIIPYELAYGESGRPPVIPAKAMLVFEVELLEVKAK